MRWQQPNFDPYNMGKRAPCRTCGGIALAQYTETRQSEPSKLAVWVPLCETCNRKEVDRAALNDAARAEDHRHFDPRRADEVGE